MLPSTASVRPPEGSTPDAFGAGKGSCTKKRRGVPADGAPGRTFTSRPAPLPWQSGSLGPGTPPGEGPVNSRPTSGRNTHLARRRGPASPRPFTTRGYDTSALPRPPWTGRQVLMRTTWPSTSMTEARTAEPHRPKPSTPDDPALERAPIAREHASPRLIPARQDRPGTRPDASAYWKAA